MYESDADINREGLQDAIEACEEQPALVVIVRIPAAEPVCAAAPCREPHDPESRHYSPDCPFTHSHTGYWCGHGCGTPEERASQS